MKAVYLAFRHLFESEGVSLKIRSQVRAIKENGIDVMLGRFRYDNDNKYIEYWIGDDIIFKQKKSPFFIINNNIIVYSSILAKNIERYIIQNDIKFVYARYEYFASPNTVELFKSLKSAGCLSVLEIPTYPYSGEASLRLKSIARGIIEKTYRVKLAQQLHRIVTFSNDKYIYGCPTINIANGVDFNSIQLKKSTISHEKKINLIGVANLRYWHGFDRIIEGLKNYYQTKHSYLIFFNIVGDGDINLKNKLMQDVKRYQLSEYVFFHGNTFNSELDDLFNNNDIAIGCLGRHRTKIKKLQSLKNAEYAARGIPFVYSEDNDIFDKMPYVLKVSADESPIDINSIINLYQHIDLTPLNIRESVIDTLSWKVQMKKVIDSLRY